MSNFNFSSTYPVPNVMSRAEFEDIIKNLVPQSDLVASSDLEISNNKIAIKADGVGITQLDLASSNSNLEDDGSGKIRVAQTMTGLTSVTSAQFNGPLSGNVTGDLTGDVTGNASTATALETSRTITLGGDLTGSASFDGTSNITLNAQVANNKVALGTDTTGSYVAVGTTSGPGISGTSSTEAGTFTVTSNATSTNTASTIVYRNSNGDFSAGTITASLSGNATSADTLSSVGTAGQILATNSAEDGVEWVNNTPTLEALTDTSISNSVTDGSILFYDGTSGQERWEDTDALQISAANSHVGIAGSPESDYELSVNGNIKTSTTTGDSTLLVHGNAFGHAIIRGGSGGGRLDLLDDGEDNETFRIQNAMGESRFQIKNGSTHIANLLVFDNTDGRVGIGGNPATSDTYKLNVIGNTLIQPTGTSGAELRVENGGGAQLDLVDTGITQSNNNRATLKNADGLTSLDIYRDTGAKVYNGFRVSQSTGNWSWGDRTILGVTQNDTGTNDLSGGRPGVGIGRSSRATFAGSSATANHSIEGNYVISSGTCTVTFTDVVTDIQPYDRVYVSDEEPISPGTLSSGWYTVLTTNPSGFGITEFTFQTSDADVGSKACKAAKQHYTADFHLGFTAPSTNLNGSLNSSATTITVDSGGTQRFPTSGCIVIGGETISYGSKTSTSFTNCVRGVQGTQANSHSDNTTVTITDLDKQRHYGWLWAHNGANFGGAMTLAYARKIADSKSVYSDIAKGIAKAWTRVSGSHTSTATEIEVESTDGFSNNGQIRINSEIINYSGLGASPPRFQNCTRGVESTAQAIVDNDLVVSQMTPAAALIEGGANGHIVAAIRGNDAQDGFHVVSARQGIEPDDWADQVDDINQRANWENTAYSVLRASNTQVVINAHEMTLDFIVKGDGGEVLKVDGDNNRIILSQLPTSTTTNLPTGTIYKDTNGFLKIA